MQTTKRTSRWTQSLNLIPPGQELPFQTLRKSIAVGIVVIVFSLLWIAASLAVIVWVLLRGGLSPMVLLPLLPVGIGVGLFLLGVWLLTSVKEWTFTKEAVACHARSAFGRKEWEEPLTAYRGVLSKSEYHSGGKNHPSYTLYKLSLVHPAEKRRSVQLYCSSSREGFRREHERYARLFGLPALEETDDGVVERSPDELDKSVQELATEGRLKVQFDPSAPLPGKRLAVRTDEQFLHISTRAVLSPVLAVAFGLDALMGTALLVVGLTNALGVRAPLIAVGALMAVVGLVGCIVAAVVRLVRPQLSVSPDEVRKRYVTPWGSFSEQKIPAAQVEQAVVGKPTSGTGGNVVRVESDEQAIEFGAGLSDAEKRWVRDCVISVIIAGSGASAG